MSIHIQLSHPKKYLQLDMKMYIGWHLNTTKFGMTTTYLVFVITTIVTTQIMSYVLSFAKKFIFESYSMLNKTTGQ